MKLSTKILAVTGSTLVVGSLGFIAYKQFEISNRQIAIESQMVKQMQLVDGIVRSQSEYATRKDVERFAKDNGVNINAIKNDLSKLNAEISAVNVVKTHSAGYVATNVASTSTGHKNPDPLPINKVICDGKEVLCPSIDPNKYYTNQQKLQLFEPFGNTKVPVGDVGFSAWKNKPWDVNIRPREYQITNVTGTDENERTYFYNKLSIKVDGKTYDISIDKTQTKQVYPESQFSFFNPRLYLGAAGGLTLNSSQAEANANLQVSIMSYGRYKRQPDFTVLGIGAAYQFTVAQPAFIVTPFTYNIGKHLPLMNNTYIGPSFTVDLNRNFSVMAGISVGL